MRALITGIYGQDGSFLCELLHEKGYEVYGIVRTPLSENSLRIKDELDRSGINVLLYDIDLTCYEEVERVIEECRPDEVYHMAALHVSATEYNNNVEKLAFEKNVLATSNILAACYAIDHSIRIITAGSCLMYDSSNTNIQDENTPFSSLSYYGVGKIAENQLVKMYRNKGMYACTAILYNHESHRRSNRFVTKKIVEKMVALKYGDIDSFELGNINVVKDWGYAGDYAQAMYMMLHASKAKDYVLSTGKKHTIEEFIDECAKYLDIDNWRDSLKIDEQIVKRSTNGELVGNCSLIEEELGWKKTKSFIDLVHYMIDMEISTRNDRKY